MKDLFTGFTIKEITPPIGTELSGNGVYRERKSTGVLEPLYARAMSWSFGDKTGALITCDLLGISARHVRKTREIIYSLCGIFPEDVMICCLHNHSGPTTSDILAHGEENSDYVAALPSKLAAAVETAFNNMEPSEMEYVEVPIDGIAYNREFEGGKTDPFLRMIRVRSGDRFRGIIANYSCHPVVMNIGTSLISSDFIGIALNRLMSKYEVCGLFIQGCCGDINSIYVNNPQEQALKELKVITDKFFGFLENALIKTEALKINVDEVKMVSRKVTLPLQKIHDRQLILRHIKFAEKLIELENLPEDARKQLLFEKIAFEEIWKCCDMENGDQTSTEMQAVRFGDIIIGSHPAELFYQFQEKIQNCVKEYKVIVAGYTNDFIGYIPSENRYDVSKGRYSYPAYYVPLVFKTLPFKADIGEIFTGELIKTIQEVL